MSLLVKPVLGKKKIHTFSLSANFEVQDKKNMQHTAEGTICCEQAAVNVFVLKCILSFLHPIDEHGHGGTFEFVMCHCLGFLVDYDLNW